MGEVITQEDIRRVMVDDRREALEIASQYGHREPARWARAGAPESWLEEKLIGLMNGDIRLRGTFRCNVPIGPYRPDIVFTDVRLCVEADGMEWHSSTEAVRRDYIRDWALAMMGWRVYRLRHQEITWTPDIAVDRIVAWRRLWSKIGGAHGDE